MDYLIKTDRGRKRRINQDYAYAAVKKNGRLENIFILADGMGGHKAGDLASRTAVLETSHVLENCSDMKLPAVRLIQEAVDSANRKVYELSKQNEDFQGMGTTLVVLTIEDDEAIIANIGDSRAYILHRNILRQITRDHSYVEEMVERGYMRRGSREYLESRNIITRAVGIEKNVKADIFEVPVYPGDLILMCTDGLTNMADNESIRNILKDRSLLEEKADALIELANINGGNDNIGVILVDPFFDREKS